MAARKNEVGNPYIMKVDSPWGNSKTPNYTHDLSP